MRWFYLLQHLGFLINVKKSVVGPTQKKELLELIIDSMKMTLVLMEEKLAKFTGQCQDLFSQPQTAALALTELIGILSSTP